MIANLLNLISQEQIIRLHEAALKLLWDTGMVIHNTEARELFAEQGAQVSPGSSTVKFPERVVYETVGKAPSLYTLGGRSPDQDLQLSLKSSLTRPIAGCNKIFDLDMNRRREASLQDMIRSARLVDALPQFDCNAAFIYGEEEPPPTRAIHYFKVLLENTRKHICMSPYGPQDVEYMIQMATAVQGSEEELSKRPIFNIITSPASPLIYSNHFAEAIMVGARARVPVMMGSTPITGGTSPVTLAGAVVLMHAENLVGVMIAQVAKPGSPVYMAPRPTTMDMRTGTSLWGSIEWGIASSAAIQLAHYCGLPSDFMGVGTDSKLLDQQCGIERSMLAVLAFLTAPSLISGGGYIDTISTGSLEQLVIDDEIFSMARRMVAGIQVDDEHIALDLIDRVGAGNNFMGEEHTRKHFRRDHFLAFLADRHSYGAWEELGATDITRRAHDKAESILATSMVPPIPDPVRRELEKIMDSARRQYYSQ